MRTLRTVYLSIAFLGLTSFSVWSQELRFNTQDFSPFSYEKYGVISGAATDVVRVVCKEMNITCTFKLLPWPQAQDQVKQGEANAMFVIGWSEKRAQWVHFTPPIMRTEYGVFVREGNPLEYDTLAKIEGYKIGVYGPSDAAAFLQKMRARMVKLGLRPIEIEFGPSHEGGFKRLAGDSLDAVFSDREVGYGTIARLGLEGEVRYAGPATKLKYYVGFSKAHNDAAIINHFNATYVRLRKQGVIKEILDRYFVEAAEF